MTPCVVHIPTCLPVLCRLFVTFSVQIVLAAICGVFYCVLLRAYFSDGSANLAVFDLVALFFASVAFRLWDVCEFVTPFWALVSK